MLDLVRNHEDRFSHVAAHIEPTKTGRAVNNTSPAAYKSVSGRNNTLIEPHPVKIGFWSFRPGLTQKMGKAVVLV